MHNKNTCAFRLHSIILLVCQDVCVMIPELPPRLRCYTPELSPAPPPQACCRCLLKHADLRLILMCAVTFLRQGLRLAILDGTHFHSTGSLRCTMLTCSPPRSTLHLPKMTIMVRMLASRILCRKTDQVLCFFPKNLSSRELMVCAPFLPRPVIMRWRLEHPISVVSGRRRHHAAFYSCGRSSTSTSTSTSTWPL